MTTVVPQSVIENQKKARRVEFVERQPIADTMVRITVGGEDLADFTASGPADHIRLILPDAETGELVLPTPGRKAGLGLGMGGPIIFRDYTPLNYRRDENLLDLDFVLHGPGGPAAQWAVEAKPGDQVGVAGPGRSAPAPLGVEQLVLAADETALPAVSRWLRALPDVDTTVLLSVADPSLENYFEQMGLPETASRKFYWWTGENRESEREEKLRSLDFTPSTFAYMAGEAGTIIPLRRYLRRELNLPKEQVKAEGFWKQGVAMLDHHLPVDPSDPD